MPRHRDARKAGTAANQRGPGSQEGVLGARLGGSGRKTKKRKARTIWPTPRQPENSKRAHLRVPAFKNTTKIQREDPQREKKSENGGGRGKKKREILGGPAEGGLAEGGPAEGGSRAGVPGRGSSAGGVRWRK